MARGSQILVTADPRGVFDEGTIGDTSKPGTLMMLKTSPAQTGPTSGPGRFIWIAAAPGTDGLKGLNPVLLDDPQQGILPTTAYVSGTQCKLYYPLPGEDVNLLLGEVAGTGNTYAIGDKLIVDAEDGILVPFTGSPQDTYAVCMEVVTQVAGSNLTWCKKT